LGGSVFLLATYTLWWREVIRFWREKVRLAAFVGTPLIFWFVLGSGFGNLERFFPGALTLTVMFAAVFSTMSLIEDRREGFLLSMLVSPAPRGALVLGKISGIATLAWLQGLMFLAFLPATSFRPSFTAVLEACGLLFLISLTFTALGFVIAWRMESTQGFHAVINLLLMPLWMVSGALFPLNDAHNWMRWLMLANPMTYSLAALRRVLDTNVPDTVPGLFASVLLTAICAAVLLIASAFVAGRPGSRSSA
jgi:ABC-2 type transport system permease protein